MFKIDRSVLTTLEALNPTHIDLAFCTDDMLAHFMERRRFVGVRHWRFLDSQMGRCYNLFLTVSEDEGPALIFDAFETNVVDGKEMSWRNALDSRERILAVLMRLTYLARRKREAELLREYARKLMLRFGWSTLAGVASMLAVIVFFNLLNAVVPHATDNLITVAIWGLIAFAILFGIIGVLVVRQIVDPDLPEGVWEKDLHGQTIQRAYTSLDLTLAT